MIEKFWNNDLITGSVFAIGAVILACVGSYETEPSFVLIALLFLVVSTAMYHLDFKKLNSNR